MRASTAPPAPATSEAIGNVAWVADEQTREAMIRLAAYTFYERRGYVSGSELEDWLEAEMEVDRQLAGTQPPGHVPQWAPEHAHAIAPVQTRARLAAPPAAKRATRAPANAVPKAAAKVAQPAAQAGPDQAATRKTRAKAGSTAPAKAGKGPQA
jgi:hypothetical protein